MDETLEFEKKMTVLLQEERLSGEAQEKVIGFIYSRNGFTNDALARCRELGIATSEDERWIGID